MNFWALAFDKFAEALTEVVAEVLVEEPAQELTDAPNSGGAGRPALARATLKA